MTDWQRLDPRMLLVHPVRELGRFVIPLLAFFVAGRATDNPWQFLGVLVPVALGFARYLTTRFRIAEGRVELRRGLVSRHVTSTPLERVRTVDLTASPIHRLLGLTTMRIGTGSASGGEDSLALDGLSAARARHLRAQLLRATPAEPGGITGPAPGAPAVELEPSWIRFAPFTSAGLVLAAAVVGVGSQLVGALGVDVDLDESVTSVVSSSSWSAVVLGLGVLALCAAVFSVGGYLVTNWGFRLTHGDRAWHVARGLLTTRETTLDDERVAGVSIGEPLGLRVAGGARLNAIATGLAATQPIAGGGSGSGLVPPAPRAVVDRAAAAVCGAEEPISAPLLRHGRAATTRRYTRASVVPLVLAAAAGAGVATDLLAGWSLLVAAALAAAAAGLAADRARGLGHRLVGRHLVTRSGSLLRSRDVLDVDHVIGWTFRDTWPQRRVGLTTVWATTAGGRGAVLVLDVPDPVGVGLADATSEGLLGQFLA